MKNKKFMKIAAIIGAIAILVTVGVSVFAADDDSDAKNGRSVIWNILTDDQKAQLAAGAKERLDNALADGKITQEQYDAGIVAIESGERPFFGKGGFSIGRGGRMNGGMSEEQKAEMEALREKAGSVQGKWDALTDDQKEEIYKLRDQGTDIQSQIIDKYLEFGVIDEETAAAMKEKCESRNGALRSSGKMPMFGGKGGRGQRGNRGGMGQGCAAPGACTAEPTVSNGI